MLIATAGHVDHGKTALIKALTNIETDRLVEEKTRGLSIELGFAYHSLGPSGTVGFIDVPGHEKFLSNMLSGVAGIDMAMLVIAADDGPMIQTHEHLTILQLLGISRGLVVISKADRVDSTRLQEVKNEVARLIDNSFLKDSPVFVVSSLDMQGISSLASHLDYCAGALEVPDHKQKKFRLAIDRWFNKDGHGLVVAGTVFSGSVSVGDNLLLARSQLSPSGSGISGSSTTVTKGLALIEKEETVRVRTIHSNGATSKLACAGQRCAINIAGNGIETGKLKRGDWLLATNGSPASYHFDARLTILKTEVRPFKHWTPVHVYIGAAHHIAHVAMLPTDYVIKPEETTYVRLVFEAAVYAIAGDRFIIRDQAAQRTIGGGTIIDPYGPLKGRAKLSRLQQLAEMENIDKCKALTRLLAYAPTGMKLKPLMNSWNFSDSGIAHIIEAVKPVQLSEVIFDATRWQSLNKSITDFLNAWSIENSYCQGLHPELLRKNLGLPIDYATITNILNRLIEDGSIARTGHLIHPSKHKAKISDADQKFWKIAELQFENNGRCPPVVHDLAGLLDMDVEILREKLQRMTQLGRVIKVGGNRYFPVHALKNIEKLIFQLANDNESGRFTASQFRDVSGIGRRPSIDILEFFDANGLTLRQGNERIIMGKSASIFP